MMEGSEKKTHLKYFAIATFAEDLLELKVLGAKLEFAGIDILLG